MVSGGEYTLAAAGGLRVDLDDQEAALGAIRAAAGREGGFAAVVAPDDATVELAGRVAGALGLAGNPPEAARLSRRKDLARDRLAAAGVGIPEYRVLDLRRPLDLSRIAFPCVVKPVAMSGSRGVIRANDEAELAAAVGRARSIASGALDEEERSRLLVESFVPGVEVAVEGLVRDGRLEVLAVFDKPDPLDGPYFEESIYVTPSRLGAVAEARIVACVREAVAAFGLVSGPVHAEVRWHAGEAWLLEVAARTIGGECSKLLRFSAGHSLEEVVLAAALGRRVPTGLASGAAGVMMLPTPRPGTLRRVEGVLDALRVPGGEDVSIAAGAGTELLPLPEGSAYLGYVFARGETPELVEGALREATGRLRIVIAPMWRLSPAA
ncbi:MAG: ATP-grasp domain-containing protein [Immundisolibacterales bacterium]|nr:ATP-grasp domain-containing protein [Immundisolibacterales bacterium]